MAWVPYAAINFRNSSVYVTDGAGQTYALPGDVYPTERGGVTFGWSTAPFGTNISTSGDVRVAGNNRSTSFGQSWRLDLPATGLYRVAYGARDSSPRATGLRLRDDTTVLVHIDGTLADNSDVMDITGAIHPDPATWAANPVYAELSFASTNLNIDRSSVNGVYASHLYVERWVEEELGDILTQDEFGYSAATPELYAGQPEGYRAMRLTLPAGSAYATSSFVLGGDLGAYFTIQEIGGLVWAVCNATRLPDALAGLGRSLTIEQTDSNFDDPHITAITCDVISSNGRATTGVIGRIPTQSWLYRQMVFDKYATRWPGYEGQAFDTLLTVANRTELDAALAGIADGRTVWDCIECEEGDYSGQISDYLAYGEGGGLVIRPAAGHDPEINTEFNDIRWHGVHVLNLRCPGVGVGFYQFRLQTAGTGGINDTGKFNKVKFSGNKFGLLWAAGQDLDDVIAASTTIILAEHGESVEVCENQFWGVANNCFVSAGVRTSIEENNDFRCIVGDTYNPNNAARYFSPQGVFEDDHVYCLQRWNTVRDELDQAGWYNQVHPDTWQIAAFENNISNWAVSTDITVGSRRLNMLAPTPAIYECTTAGTTEGSGTGPLRSSQGETGITDGTCVWTHIADYVTASHLYGVQEENTMNSNSELSDEGTARQSYIDSNGGKNCPAFMVIVNNAFGTESQYGVRGAGGGYIGAHFNTFARPSVMSGGQTALQSQIWSSGSDQTIIATYNVVQAATNISGANPKLLAYGEVIIDWSSASADPNRPGDSLTGPFSQLVGAGDRWAYPTLVFDGDAEDFADDMRSILLALSGMAGIQTDAAPSGLTFAFRLMHLFNQGIA